MKLPAIPVIPRELTLQGRVSCYRGIVHRNGNMRDGYERGAVVTGGHNLYLRRVERCYALVSHHTDPILAWQFVGVGNKAKRAERRALEKTRAVISSSAEK